MIQIYCKSEGKGMINLVSWKIQKDTPKFHSTQGNGVQEKDKVLLAVQSVQVTEAEAKLQKWEPKIVEVFDQRRTRT